MKNPVAGKKFFTSHRISLQAQGVRCSASKIFLAAP
jgi:hypothetical protein